VSLHSFAIGCNRTSCISSTVNTNSCHISSRFSLANNTTISIISLCRNFTFKSADMEQGCLLRCQRKLFLF